MGDCQNTPALGEMLLVLQCSACLGQRPPLGACVGLGLAWSHFGQAAATLHLFLF